MDSCDIGFCSELNVEFMGHPMNLPIKKSFLHFEHLMSMNSIHKSEKENQKKKAAHA